MSTGLQGPSGRLTGRRPFVSDIVAQRSLVGDAGQPAGCRAAQDREEDRGGAAMSRPTGSTGGPRSHARSGPNRGQPHRTAASIYVVVMTAPVRTGDTGRSGPFVIMATSRHQPHARHTERPTTS